MWDSLIYYITLACEALMGIFGMRSYEEPRYEVLARIDHRTEIRRYAPALLPKLNRRRLIAADVTKRSEPCSPISPVRTTLRTRRTLGSP